ncbi:MAG: hypothetical protein KKH61_14160, partial [Gammaproteobacteria bacterium]|nr:hypothetical protein [Gammaproteobacteria bacterium]
MPVIATVTHIAPVDSTTDIPPDDLGNTPPSTRTSPGLRSALTQVLPLLLGNPALSRNDSIRDRCAAVTGVVYDNVHASKVVSQFN